MGKAKLFVNYLGDYNSCTVRKGDYIILENIENSDEQFVCIFARGLSSFVCLNSGEHFIAKTSNVNMKTSKYENEKGDIRVKVVDIITQENVVINFDVGKDY